MSIKKYDVRWEQMYEPERDLTLCPDWRRVVEYDDIKHLLEPVVGQKEPIPADKEVCATSTSDKLEPVEGLVERCGVTLEQVCQGLKGVAGYLAVHGYHPKAINDALSFMIDLQSEQQSLAKENSTQAAELTELKQRREQVGGMSREQVMAVIVRSPSDATDLFMAQYDQIEKLRGENNEQAAELERLRERIDVLERQNDVITKLFNNVAKEYGLHPLTEREPVNEAALGEKE